MDQHAQPVAVRWQMLALVVPAVLAAVVGFWSITVPSLWRDESVTAHFARAPLGEAWREWKQYDAVHAAYYLLVRLTVWIDPLELGLRLPSVIAFVATSVGIVLLGRRLAGWPLGACAATVYVLLPVSSRFAQEGRSYALVSAVAVFATLALLRLVERSSRGRIVVYVLLVSLLGYLHLYSLLLLLAHGGHILFTERASWRRVGLAWAFAGLLLAPLIVIGAGQRQRQLFWVRQPGWSDVVHVVDSLGSTRGLTLVLVVAAVAGAWFLRRTSLLVWWLVLPVLVSFAVSQFMPMFVDRYFLFVVPALALLASAGILGAADVVGRAAGRVVRGSRVPVTASLALAAVGVLAVLGLPVQRDHRGPAGHGDDLRSMTGYLAASAQPGDVLVPLPARLLPFVNGYGGPFDRLEIATVRKIPAQTDRVWAVNQGDPRALGSAELRELSGEFKLVAVRSYGVPQLSLWARR